MIDHGGKGSGNRKLFALKCRFGEPLEYGDYLCMNFDGAKTKITEIGTKFELSKNISTQNSGFEITTEKQNDVVDDDL